MGSEAESEPNSTPKLPLFSIAAMKDSEPSGTQTPPLQTIASVPFRWEEEPGKPRPCTALVALSKSSSARCLDPPPRLFFSDVKMPSPTTVLEGPYAPRSVFQSSSFRVIRDRRHSFGGGGGGGGSPQRGQVLGRRRFFGGWRRRNQKGKIEACRSLDLDEGSSTADGTTGDCDSGGETIGRVMRMSRSGSSLSLSNARSHFWVSLVTASSSVHFDCCLLHHSSLMKRIVFATHFCL